MHKNTRALGLFLVLATALGGVTAPRPATAETYLDFLIRVYGLKISLVGRDLNGMSLNGHALDGRVVASVSLDGVQQDGKPHNLSLSATKFTGFNGAGQGASANKAVGAIFTGALDNGVALPVRIDDVQKSTESGFTDMYRYTVSYQTTAGWVPLCGVGDDGAPAAAIPLDGTWNLAEGVEGGGAHVANARRFTFACEGYVLAKCVYAGYKPWRSIAVCSHGNACETVSLSSLHQACTRAMRADYCGDGRSFTMDDTAINLYDGYGIRVDSDVWSFEAEWDADGALCMARDRLPGGIDPECAAWLNTEDCNDPAHFFEGTRLMTEVE